MLANGTFQGKLNQSEKDQREEGVCIFIFYDFGVTAMLQYRMGGFCSDRSNDDRWMEKRSS